MPPTYASRRPFDPARPTALVIACSDGRLQEAVDEFLAVLGVTHYDRLYLPGGPGALADSGVSYLRAGECRREAAFLIAAHGIEEVYLVFHGPAEDGPADAVCGDYRRKLPNHTPAQIREQQARDADDVLRNGFGWNVSPRVHAFRCEVTGAAEVRFVELSAERSPVGRPHPLAI